MSIIDDKVLDDDRTGPGRRATDPPWPLERWLLVGTFLCSVLGFTFALGVTWSRISDQKARVDTLEQFKNEEMPQQYVPRELYNTDQRYLADSIRRLNTTLDAMLQEDRASARRQQLERERNR